MAPTVSINLCCYNSKKYLRETLDSIVNQTYKDWELVVINDGSSDLTESIIKEYIDKGYPIVYHYQENHGLGYSRNEALKRSSGEFIAFIDHDDIWLPEKLEKQVPLFNDSKIDFVYSNFYKFDDKGKRRLVSKNTKQEGNLFESLLCLYDIGILTVILRAVSLKKLDKLFDPILHLAEEYDLFMRLLYCSQAIYMPEPLAMHRVHSNMSTRLYWREFSEEIESVNNNFKNIDPSFSKIYASALKCAKIQLEFQKAKDNMVQGELKYARNCIAPYKWHNLRCFMLYSVSYLPVSFWFLLRPIWAKNTFR